MKISLSAFLTVIIIAIHMPCKGQKENLYVGTMDQRESKGIYVYEYNRAANTFTLLQTNPEIKNPNFLVIHPGGKYLYSVNTVRGNDGKRFEAVSSFAINKTNGILKFINQIPTYGKATCHVSIDHKGRFVLVANMNSDSIISLSLDKSTGRRKSNGLTLSLPAPCCLKWLML